MNEEAKNMVSASELAEFCVKAAEDRKAEDIVALHVSEVTFIADYFIICTVSSTVQGAAVQSHIERSVREVLKVRPISVEGDAMSGWVLIDFGTVVVHIMSAEQRAKYQIEKLWGDAPTIEDQQTLGTLRPGKA